MTNDRIRNLAERALALSQNDIVRAVEIMREMTGLSFEMAFAAIDAVAVLDEVQSPECSDPIKDAPL